MTAAQSASKPRGSTSKDRTASSHEKAVRRCRPQTLDPGLQAAIGRVQPQEQVVRSVERLRAAGVA
jgi:coproporphyrinogen III oxidase-like Fe-S oxidoreductase